MTKHIYKANDFLNGSYRPGTIWQMRVLHAAMRQINPTEPLDHNKEISVSASALALLTGEHPTKNDLKSAALELASMIVTLQNDPKLKTLKTDNAGEHYIHIVSECRHIKDEDRIALRFSAAVIPLISELRAQFSKLDVRHVMSMRSAFGVRLYELCMKFSGLVDFKLEYDLQKFRLLMGVAEEKYMAFGDLNARVIRPALKDINENSDMEISCFGRKEARKVVGLTFEITRSEKNPLTTS